eukprot:403344320
METISKKQNKPQITSIYSLPTKIEVLNFRKVRLNFNQAAVDWINNGDLSKLTDMHPRVIQQLVVANMLTINYENLATFVNKFNFVQNLFLNVDKDYSEEESEILQKLLDIIKPLSIKVDIFQESIQQSSMFKPLILNSKISQIVFNQVKHLPRLDDDIFRYGIIGRHLTHLVYKRSSQPLIEQSLNILAHSLKHSSLRRLDLIYFDVKEIKVVCSEGLKELESLKELHITIGDIMEEISELKDLQFIEIFNLYIKEFEEQGEQSLINSKSLFYKRFPSEYQEANILTDLFERIGELQNLDELIFEKGYEPISVLNPKNETLSTIKSIKIHNADQRAYLNFNNDCLKFKNIASHFGKLQFLHIQKKTGDVLFTWKHPIKNDLLIEVLKQNRNRTREIYKTQ